MSANESFSRNHTKELRLLIYFIAFLIQILLTIFFQDGNIFYDTSLDLFVNHSIIYANTTLQNTFNYFPFVYLVTMPQLWLYYQLPFRNDVLLRLFFKTPVIFADLVLAYLFSDKILQKYGKVKLSQVDQNGSSNRRFINNFELFVLFNPINIYITGMGNQIDVFPAVFLVLAWFAYKNEKYYLSGITVMSAFLIKEYAVFLMLMLFIVYFKNSIVALRKYLIGNLLVFIPIIGIVSLINFKGFIDHAFLYQLLRQPAGSSLSVFVYGAGVGILPSTLLPLYQALINITSFGIIFLAMVYGCYSIYKQPSQKNVILFTVISFLTFCIFNKVFWPQYLVSLIALWLLYRIEVQKPLSDKLIYWVITFMPTLILYRVGDFSTHALVNFLGPNYFLIVVLIAYSVHFIILFIFIMTNKINLKNGRAFLIYFIIFSFSLLLVYFQWYIVHLSSYTIQSMPS